jgi:hypothetical protein
MRFSLKIAALAMLAGIALLAAPAAIAKNDVSAKPHAWQVVLLRGKVHDATSNPDDACPFPVFRKGRGDQIQFVSRDVSYWIRFRTPSPLRLKGEVIQRIQVYPIGITPNPIYTFTTDAPADSVDWERFPFEIHDRQDMPKDTADQPREQHTGERPKPPSLKELQKQKLEVDLVIDGIK